MRIFNSDMWGSAKVGLASYYGTILVTKWSQLRAGLRKVSAAVSTLKMYLEETWEASVLPLNHSRDSI